MNMKTIKEYVNIFIDFIINNINWLMALLLYVFITYFFHIVSCPIKLIIGYPCIGCGMSRAILSLVSLNFKEAFIYHPFVFFLPFIMFVIIFKSRKNILKIYRQKWLWVSLTSLLILIYIIRMFLIYPNYPLDYNENNLINFIINLLKKCEIIHA
ncbi:MAG: DUF2752 domain-containing protein [Erysipelotrichaceae bacterium]|nr:DUF2752 domain-containing protein [Erysipelotrichaceae bacterium]